MVCVFVWVDSIGYVRLLFIYFWGREDVGGKSEGFLFSYLAAVKSALTRIKRNGFALMG